ALARAFAWRAPDFARWPGVGLFARARRVGAQCAVVRCCVAAVGCARARPFALARAFAWRAPDFARRPGVGLLARARRVGAQCAVVPCCFAPVGCAAPPPFALARAFAWRAPDFARRPGVGLLARARHYVHVRYSDVARSYALCGFVLAGWRVAAPSHVVAPPRAAGAAVPNAVRFGLGLPRESHGLGFARLASHSGPSDPCLACPFPMM